VENGETGYLISSEPEWIAETVCFLLQNPQKARAMGMNGRRRIEQHFSDAEYLKAMEKVFRDVLDNQTVIA
jgi:glycosyltransferase involved in cell wall biosynthesis